VGQSLADSQGTGIPVSQTRKAHAKREHSAFNFEIHLKITSFWVSKKSERFNLNILRTTIVRAYAKLGNILRKYSGLHLLKSIFGE